MLLGIIIAVFVYSLILTVVFVYKDNSGYFHMDGIDAVIGGPCMWALLLLVALLRPLLKKGYEKRKNQPYEAKSEDYIEKVIQKVMKLNENRFEDEVFDLSRMFSSEYGDVLGWEDLEVKEPRYERLNRKFERIMLNQADAATKELKKWFEAIPGNKVDSYYWPNDAEAYRIRQKA